VTILYILFVCIECMKTNTLIKELKKYIMMPNIYLIDENKISCLICGISYVKPESIQYFLNILKGQWAHHTDKYGNFHRRLRID